MKKTITTTISLTYKSDGFVAITPADAAEIVQLDETCQQVKRGYLIVEDLEPESYEATSGPEGSTVNLRFIVRTAFDGEPEALDAALETGWLEWPEEIENDELGAEDKPLRLTNAKFENKVDTAR